MQHVERRPDGLRHLGAECLGSQCNRCPGAVLDFPSPVRLVQIPFDNILQAQPHQIGRCPCQAICLGLIKANNWGVDMQEADISTFWEAMISALLKADMVSPLKSPANPV